MKNKKLSKLLATITLGTVAVGALGLFGCGKHDHKFSQEWSSDASGHYHAATCKEHPDERADFAEHVFGGGDQDKDCDVCGYERTVTPAHTHTYATEWSKDENKHWYAATCEHTTEKKDEADHVWDNGQDTECNVCGQTRTPLAQYTISFNLNDKGAAVEAVTVDENAKATKPTDPTDTNYNFAGWYEAADLSGEAFNFEATAITANKTLYAKWTHKHTEFATAWLIDGASHFHACATAGCPERKDEGAHRIENNKCTDCNTEFKEEVYKFVPTDLEVKVYSEGQSFGIFSILPNTEVRTRTRECSIYDYNNGAGTTADVPIKTGFSAKQSLKLANNGNGLAINVIGKGRLTFYVDDGSGKTPTQTVNLIKPDGSQETFTFPKTGMYAITVDCNSVGTYKITKGNATSDIYYAEFKATLPITPVERIEVADGGVVDYIKGQEFDKNKLQVKAIRELTGLEVPLNVADLEVDSTAFDNTNVGTYKIKVKYTVDSKEFKTEYDVKVYAVEKLTLGFNAIKTGGTAAGNTAYINHAVQQFYFKGQELSTDGLTVRAWFNNDTQNFIVTKGFTVEGFNKDTAGKQTVTVKWTDNPEKTATFTVYVADYAAASIDKTVETLTINVDKELAETAIGTKSGEAYQFKTIQQALDFLDIFAQNTNTKKVINLAKGTYKEKLEIVVPNLTIKGAEVAADKVSETMIEWDSLFDQKDESGFKHETDSTATLNVRDTAVGFALENVTVSNWYNSTANFVKAFGKDPSEHRALAVLIQADKVVVDNCRFLGYQDTIEFFTGRQIIKNTYINGKTDFIFGTNNTTYFYKCTIESIVDGGYVTAFKGFNKTDKTSGKPTDDVVYGAIFNECEFIAPKAVMDKADTSLGRPWGAYAAVAVINSTIGRHVSKKPYADTEKGLRYLFMGAVKPTDSTVKFVEYGNTGEGAVTAEVAGMKMLTAEQAANYSDFSKIFAATNGNQTYSNAWDGSKGIPATQKTYKFNESTLPGGHNNTTDAEESTNIFGGDMTVVGKWKTEYSTAQTPGKDFAWLSVGTKIIMNVVGEVSVTTYGGQYGAADNIDVIYVNGKAHITIVEGATALTNGNMCCVTKIELDKTVTNKAHVHKMSNWVVSDENLPTEAAAGKAVKTCIDCESTPAHTEELTLPELSADNYTVSASQTSGKAKYTYTVPDNGGTVEFEANELAGQHTHSYGDWVLSEGVNATTAGTATKTCTSTTCNNDSTKAVTVDVPALNDSGYTITKNTATLQAAGTGTYSITVGSETVTFTAATPKVELTEITATETVYNFVAGNVVSTNKMLLTFTGQNLWDNGSYLCMKSDGAIYIKVAANSTIKISGGYYGSGWGLYKASEFDVTTGTSTTVLTDTQNDSTNGSGGSTFVSTNGGYIKIETAAGATQCSLKKIEVVVGTVTPPPSSSLTTITEAKTLKSSVDGLTSTEFVEFTGVQSHNNGAFWLFKNGTGATIKIKVAANATVTLKCSYWGNSSKIIVNGTAKEDLVNNTDVVIDMSEGGELTITNTDIPQDVYLQEIVVSFAS